MGLGASQARLLMLTARKSDLELQLQFVNQARMQIANMVSALFSSQANLDPGGPQSQKLQSTISSIQERDKVLELQSRRIDTQHQAVQTEIDAVSKVISKNIESSFKLMG
jgi:uncharacterized membrane protein YcjF (UPF0283 family)